MNGYETIFEVPHGGDCNSSQHAGDYNSIKPSKFIA